MEALRFPEYKFTEFCKGSYKNRKPPTVIEVGEVSQYRADNPNTPAWVSHFRFQEDFKKHCATPQPDPTKPGKTMLSVAGYEGSCYSGNLWFDVDVKGTEPGEVQVKALAEALELTQRLINMIMRGYEYPSDGIRCYFTGSKGFNVGLFMEAFGLEPSRDFNDRCLYLVKKIATVETTDGKESQSIKIDEDFYDRTRLHRIPNTPNDISQLYKIPLTVNEILECTDVNQIIDMARKPRTIKQELLDPAEFDGDLANLLDGYNAQPSKPTPGTSTGPKKKGKHDYAAILRGELEGESRTGNLCTLAGLWQKQGIPLDQAIATGQAWDKGNGLELDTDPAYSYSEGKVAYTISDLYKRNDAETSNAESEDIPRADPIDGKTFSSMAQRPTPMLVGGGLIPGIGFTMLAGYAKAGKTTLAVQMGLSIISATPFFKYNIEKPNAKVLYAFLENDPTQMQTIQNSQIDNWGAAIDPTNMSFLESYGLCLDYVEDRDWLQSHLKEIDLCVIDPVSLAMKKSMNDYEVVREFGTMIKKIGRETDTAFLLIHNLKKPGAVKQDPMFLICGSTAWINIAESIITVGRWDETKPPSYSRLSVKPRYAPEPEDMCLYRNDNTFELFADPDKIPKARTENVTKLVKDFGPIGFNALTQALMEGEGVSRRTATRKIQQAFRDELITRDAQEKYIYPQKEII